MIKLGRNALADHDFEYETKSICFKFIRRLHKLQENINFKFANRLSNTHINFRNQVMNVSLAAQTLSSGVADALAFLQSENDILFQGCDGTIEFIQVFDRLFDIMNSRSVYGKGFKSPMSLANKKVWEEVFDNSAKYILGLKCEGMSILSHSRKTFALGFLINIYSFKNLALDLLTPCPEIANPLHYFLTYKCSQDALELYFSCIRSCGGNNNNPNSLQLRYTLRKLLFRNSITPSPNVNCISDENDVNELSTIFNFSPLALVDTLKEGEVDDIFADEEDLFIMCYIIYVELLLTNSLKNILEHTVEK